MPDGNSGYPPQDSEARRCTTARAPSRGRPTSTSPPGTYEEEYAREGFFGKVSHLYRSHPPVDWTAIEGDLRPTALHTARLTAPGDDWVRGRVPFLQNADCTIGFCRLKAPMERYFRNADGDDVLFIHQGAGRLETDFGNLELPQAATTSIIPRGTVYRLAPTGGDGRSWWSRPPSGCWASPTAASSGSTRCSTPP
jgi:homogentisate 1,2-dioxygenase